jgi:hypothetical protein
MTTAADRTPPEPALPSGTAAYTEATLTLAQVNAIGLPLSLVLLAACLVPYVIAWGLPSLLAGLKALGWWVIPVMVTGVLAHEGLHALGWKVWGRLRWADIRLGFQWKALMPYAHARVPMTARAYRLGAALPGMITGVLPVLAALIVGLPVVLLLGAFFVTAAVGDLMVIWAIRRLPADAKVLDHPSLPGCLVLRDDVV